MLACMDAPFDTSCLPIGACLAPAPWEDGVLPLALAKRFAQILLN